MFLESIFHVQVVPGKGSLPEVRISSCKQCGEELCGGACQDYMYENYARSQVLLNIFYSLVLRNQTQLINLYSSMN